MFCKINGKYYVKVSNFYQELQVVDNNIIPTHGETKRLYSPVSEYEVVSSAEILEASKKKNKKFKKENDIIF